MKLFSITAKGQTFTGIFATYWDAIDCALDMGEENPRVVAQ
jgi:hypothetical protein